MLSQKDLIIASKLLSRTAFYVYMACDELSPKDDWLPMTITSLMELTKGRSGRSDKPMAYQTVQSARLECVKAQLLIPFESGGKKSKEIFKVVRMGGADQSDVESHIQKLGSEIRPLLALVGGASVRIDYNGHTLSMTNLSPPHESENHLQESSFHTDSEEFPLEPLSRNQIQESSFHTFGEQSEAPESKKEIQESSFHTIDPNPASAHLSRNQIQESSFHIDAGNAPAPQPGQESKKEIQESSFHTIEVGTEGQNGALEGSEGDAHRSGARGSRSKDFKDSKDDLILNRSVRNDPDGQDRSGSGVVLNDFVTEYRQQTEILARHSMACTHDRERSMGLHIAVWNHARRINREFGDRRGTGALFKILHEMQAAANSDKPQGARWTSATEKAFTNLGRPRGSQAETPDLEIIPEDVESIRQAVREIGLRLPNPAETAVTPPANPAQPKPPANDYVARASTHMAGMAVKAEQEKSESYAWFNALAPNHRSSLIQQFRAADRMLRDEMDRVGGKVSSLPSSSMSLFDAAVRQAWQRRGDSNG